MPVSSPRLKPASHAKARARIHCYERVQRLVNVDDLRLNLGSQASVASGRLVDSGSSILKWAGGKASLSKTILPIVRQHLRRCYIEPFAGSAALFFRLEPKAAILGDANPHLMRLYAEIKHNPDGVSRSLDRLRMLAEGLTGQAFSTFYYNMRDAFPRRNRSDNAALMIFLNQHCWNGLYRENASGRFNTPIGSYSYLRAMPTTQQLLRASHTLKDASIQYADFETVARMARPGDFIYFDPPYAPASPTARFTSYASADFSWQDQVRLKKLLYDLRRLNIAFLLSNSASPMMTSFYKDFDQSTVQVSRSINSVGSKRTGFSELLVSHFPLFNA